MLGINSLSGQISIVKLSIHSCCDIFRPALQTPFGEFSDQQSFLHLDVGMLGDFRIWGSLIRIFIQQERHPFTDLLRVISVDKVGRRMLKHLPNIGGWWLQSALCWMHASATKSSQPVSSGQRVSSIFADHMGKRHHQSPQDWCPATKCQTSH